MFTYHENRVLFAEDGRLEFPCDVSAVIEFSPSAVYGDAVAGMTCAHGSQVRMMWNANTGRTEVEGRPSLPVADVARKVGSIGLKIVGHTAHATWHCSSLEDLHGTLGALHFVLPLCASLEFADPTTTAVASGSAGSILFVWQVEATRGKFETVLPADRDARLQRALMRVPLLCAAPNVRLLAAAAYFQKASRLFLAGIGPSEFAGEAVVNLAKCLDVLFPAGPTGTRDAVRRGLAELGYDTETIERTFVMSLLLRSSLDAAHVRMAVLTADERRKLQLYLEQVLARFRDLLRDVAERMAEGLLELLPHDSERAADDELARLLRCI
ncbi:MAG TPA: hypothetical protein VN969_10765 [Streptosporangiaceae bacterium]|nr:hypothetical protein [Streptosporangiaceae bacterium]